MVATAIIGSAVVGAGASMAASSKAANASQKATDASTALQREQYDQTRKDLDPFKQTGYAANSEVARRLGIPTAVGAPSSGTDMTGAPLPAGTGGPGSVALSLSPSAGAGPTYSAYEAANPDLAAEARRAVNPNGQNTPETGFKTAEDYYRWHDQNFAGENRASFADPVAAATPQPTATTATPTGSAAEVQPGTYGTTANPSYTAPGTFQRSTYSFDPQAFADSPIIKAALERGTGEVMAGSAAGGWLQSGAAAKAIQDRAIETAYKFYDGERAFGYGQYRDDRNFDYGQYVDDRNYDRSIYEDDRDYLTGRFDTQTNNLLNLSSAGQNAAGMVANAGQNMANQSSAALRDNAATRGSSYLAAAGSVNNLLGSGLSAYAYSQKK